jgi:hypothetical protein
MSLFDNLFSTKYRSWLSLAGRFAASTKSNKTFKLIIWIKSKEKGEKRNKLSKQFIERFYWFFWLTVKFACATFDCQCS